MKKFISLIFSSLIITIFMFADFYGTYLPVTFIDEFENSLNYNKAMFKADKEYQDVLYVRENEIATLLNGLDSGTINDEEKALYKYDEKDGDVYLTDDKGFIYKRVSEDTAFNTFDTYIYNTLFNTIKDNKRVTLLNNSDIKIDNITYHLELIDPFFVEDLGDIAFFLRNKETHSLVGVRLSSIGAKGYKICKKQDSKVRQEVTDNLIFSFPLFSYKPLAKLDETPLNEIRIYRNFQFARHGYIFNSEDLNNIFKSFIWYEGKTKDVTLTKGEKEKVDLCIRIENGEKISNLDYKTPTDLLLDVFGEESYKVDIYNNTKTFMVAHNLLDDKNKICDKCVIYSFTKEGVKVHFRIEGKNVYSNNELIYTLNLPSSSGEFYGWNVLVRQDDKGLLSLTITPTTKKGKNTYESLYYDMNLQGYFEAINIMEKYKEYL